ncbi:DUF5819 family protein [Paludifilum halophilum]|uniref:Uncharacterized protein n=1 Tax=Paludifilum halophilum TaxID=1642702 RepID=A0A235B3R3_9BACL|nr:DUF5819 family protein [Paludifilum halophilum]OYD06940.1 hypothetical protein CHM34_13455 [Paludifilum halophilum]
MKVKRIALLLWILLLAGSLILHFSVASLYLSPDNPVKTKAWDFLHDYMDPWFTQNWKLFAPNPVSQHQSLWVKMKVENPQTGGLTETDWKDITQPLVLKHQESRISSEARVLRYMESGSQSFLDEEADRKKRGKWMIQRAASTAVGPTFSGKRIRQIKVRVVSNTFPRFDQRHKPDDTGTLHFQETDWMPYSPVDSAAAKEWPR